MSIQTSQQHSRDPLEALLVERFLEEAALHTRSGLTDAIWSEPQLLGNEAKSDPEFLGTVRASLHAASRHIQLGHSAQSFRDCSHSTCRDAANLIPGLEIEREATDEELDAIFDRALARCFATAEAAA